MCSNDRIPTPTGQGRQEAASYARVLYVCMVSQNRRTSSSRKCICTCTHQHYLKTCTHRDLVNVSKAQIWRPGSRHTYTAWPTCTPVPRQQDTSLPPRVCVPSITVCAGQVRLPRMGHACTHPRRSSSRSVEMGQRRFSGMLPMLGAFVRSQYVPVYTCRLDTCSRKA